MAPIFSPRIRYIYHLSTNIIDYKKYSLIKEKSWLLILVIVSLVTTASLYPNSKKRNYFDWYEKPMAILSSFLGQRPFRRSYLPYSHVGNLHLPSTIHLYKRILWCGEREKKYFEIIPKPEVKYNYILYGNEYYVWLHLPSVVHRKMFTALLFPIASGITGRTITATCVVIL